MVSKHLHLVEPVEGSTEGIAFVKPLLLFTVDRDTNDMKVAAGAQDVLSKLGLTIDLSAMLVKINAPQTRR